MSKKGAGAPQPDFAGIIAAQSAAQQTQTLNQIARDQLAWAKQQYGQDQATIKPIIDQFISNQKSQADWAKSQQQFWDQTYKPMEAQFAKDAANWDSPERIARETGRSMATVQQQVQGARTAAEQELKDYGVNPNSGRFQATNLASRVVGGAATAAAANQTREDIHNQGMALREQAINIGRGYPGAVATTYGTAQNAGNSAIGGTLNTTGMGANIMGTGPQYYGMGNNAMATWGNISNNNYQNYLQGYKMANEPMSSGVGAALGLIGGMASAYKFADGGDVPDGASPTQGAAVDDVPARLTAGEFVVPKRAVEWFGEKHMHELIAKADKERSQLTQQSGAVPDVGPATQAPPTFVSRSQPAAALPMG